MKIFGIMDVKAKFFLHQFFDKSNVSALRGFDVAVNSADSSYRRFPDDFALCELGEMDIHTGKITGLDVPYVLSTARALVREEPSQPALQLASK